MTRVVHRLRIETCATLHGILLDALLCGKDKDPALLQARLQVLTGMVERYIFPKAVPQI